MAEMIDDCGSLITKRREFCLFRYTTILMQKMFASGLTFVSPQLLGVTLELRRTGGGGLTVFTDDLRAILEAPTVTKADGGDEREK